MSHGLVEVVGPSHWSFMALVMYKVLKRCIPKSLLVKTEIPPGVLIDAECFTNLVLETLATGDTPSNPPASFQARQIANRAAERVVGHRLSLEESETLIRGCRLISDVEGNTEESRDTRLLEFMSSFFIEIHRMGEEERSAMHSRDDDLDE